MKNILNLISKLLEKREIMIWKKSKDPETPSVCQFSGEKKVFFNYTRNFK